MKPKMSRDELLWLAKSANAHMRLVNALTEATLARCEINKLEEEGIEKGFEVRGAVVPAVQGDATFPH